MGKLRCGVATLGRFHMFDLARQLLRLGQDVQMFSGYPGFKIDPDLRAISQTRSFRVVLEHIRGRLPIPQKTTWWADRSIEDFGAWLGRKVERTELDFLDALAGTGLEAGRILRRRGIKWACNRGSTHILTQKRLLEEEHARWGAAPPYFSSRGLRRSLAEYEECDAVLVPSEFARQSFIDHGFSPSRVFKVPYGVDLSLFNRTSSPVLRHSRLRVVFAGTCSIQKGIGYLLDAMKPLVQSGRVEVFIFGSVLEEAKAILSAHSGEFTHRGLVPRTVLARELAQYDVIVLPSVQEGLALVLSQAMACGLAVIATPNTGAEDLISNGVEGFIVPFGNAHAIADRVEWMLENGLELSGMKAAALKRVQRMGGWDTYGEMSLRMYHSIMGDE
jgi:glycosyltransferase involved in cell wall biosynthesis